MAPVQEMDPATSHHSRRAPRWCCALVTIVTAPFSFSGTLYATTAGHEDFNAPAVAAHLFLCLVLILPLALGNSFLVAPCIAGTAHTRPTVVASHLILAVAWVGLVLSEDLVASQFPTLMDRLLLLWNLAILLGPAVIAGSFAYSLMCNSILRKLTPVA